MTNQPKSSRPADVVAARAKLFARLLDAPARLTVFEKLDLAEHKIAVAKGLKISRPRSLS